jgi:hypothetical protein
MNQNKSTFVSMEYYQYLIKLTMFSVSKKRSPVMSKAGDYRVQEMVTKNYNEISDDTIVVDLY